MKKKLGILVICMICILAMLTGCTSSVTDYNDDAYSNEDQQVDDSQQMQSDVSDDVEEPTPTPKKKKKKKKKKQSLQSNECWVGVEVQFYNTISTIFAEMPEIGDLYLDGRLLDYQMSDLDGNERDDYMMAYVKVTKGEHELEIPVEGFDDPVCAKFTVEDSNMYDLYGDDTKGRKKSSAAVYYFKCTLKRFGHKIDFEEKYTDNYDDEEE